MRFLVLPSLLLTAPLASASLDWVGTTGGGDGSSLFQEANWVDSDTATAPPDGTVDGSLALPSFPGGINLSGLGLTVSNTYGPFSPNFDIGANALNISFGLLQSLGNGLRVNGATDQPNSTVTLTDEGALWVQFILDIDLSLQDSSNLTLNGGGNPINRSSVDLGAAWSGSVHWNAETVAAARSEHLAKFTLTGSPVTEGTDVWLIPDGGTGSYLFTASAADSDTDGMADVWELGYFGDLSRDGTLDFDADGATDAAEFAAKSDTTLPDTDGDGLTDGQELSGSENGFDGAPTDPTLVDSDGDGFSDKAETDFGSNPNDAASVLGPEIQVVHATPTEIRTAGMVRVHWRTNAGESLVINDGSSDVASFTSTLDGQAFLDAGSTDLAVAADTTFTITVSNVNGSSQATTSVTVLTVGDPVSYSETILGDSAVAYWQFEEAAGSPTFFDSANNDHDSKQFSGGITASEPGAVGTAFRNDGSGSIVVDLQLDPQSSWSVEAIVRPDSAQTTTDQHIVANRDGAGTGRSNFFIDQDGTLQSFVGGAGRFGTNPVADASWCHVVMTVEFDALAADPAAPYILRYYIDGDLDTEIFDVPIESSVGDWVISSHKSSTSAFLTGSLDEVSIYDTTLDEATITAHFNAFRSDPGATPLLGFITSADAIGEGSSATLSWKLSGTATTAVLTDDGGNTIVADATAASSVAVSPLTTTTYTLTVNGSIVSEITIGVTGAIILTGLEFNEFNEFEVTATNLVEGQTYDLFASGDLDFFFQLGAPITADASGTATFVDIFPPTGSQYYRVEAIGP